MVDGSDPIKQCLGPGISAYNDYLLNIGKAILLMMIFHVPVMLIYGSYGFYDMGLATISLGNMGFAQSICEIESVSSFDKINL